MEDFGNAMAEQHEGVTHSEEGVSHIAGVLHSGDGDGLTINRVGSSLYRDSYT